MLYRPTMLVGVGLFGLLAASLASFFVEQQQEATLERSLQMIEERLERIEMEIRRQAETVAEPSQQQSAAPTIRP